MVETVDGASERILLFLIESNVLSQHLEVWFPFRGSCSSCPIAKLWLSQLGASAHLEFKNRIFIPSGAAMRCAIGSIQ